MSFPKDKPPHSVKVLHSWIAAYATETGQVPERIMRSVSYMIASLALERARDDHGAPLFLVKGGVMIELRLGLRARATRDLDAVFRADFATWLDHFDEAIRQPVGDFTLTVPKGLVLRPSHHRPPAGRPARPTPLTASFACANVTDMTATEIAVRAFAEQLEQLEHRGELELQEPERAGRRGALIVAAASVWARHLGGLLDSEQTRDLLGVKSRQAVHDLVRRGRLLRVEDSAGRSLYPANQFDAHGRPFALVAELIETFRPAGVSPWTIASFLSSPQRELDGRTPQRWLLAGGEEHAVRESAGRIAARLSH